MPLLDAMLHPINRGVLGLEHARKRFAAMLTDDDNDLALAGLMLGETTIDAVFRFVRRADVTAEVCAVDGSLWLIVTDDAALHFLGHRFAQLVQQHERGLVGRAEVARQRQRVLALHFVCTHHDSRQVDAQRLLVAGE